MIDRTVIFSPGTRIRSLRLAQKVTQDELAAKAAITAKYLSLIETDRREATVHVYRCIAKALDVPVWQLFCDLPNEALLVLKHFEDCSEVEIRALERFIDGNKHALRQHHQQEIGSQLEEHSYGQ